MGNISNTYKRVSEISGLSEDIVKRVYKSTKKAVIESLKSGDSVTVPSICTLTPVIKHRLQGANSMQTYIRVKAKASSALESEFKDLGNYTVTDLDEDLSDKDNEIIQQLNFSNEVPISAKAKGVKVQQIETLL